MIKVDVQVPCHIKLLKKASKNQTRTNEMKSVADSPAWYHIDNIIDREFSIERRHLQMELSLDGVNLFSMQMNIHSTWPMMVLLYNLSPWLVTKKFFTSLCLIISKKESPTSDNMNIYLSPLREELQQLWEGVDVFKLTLE